MPVTVTLGGRLTAFREIISDGFVTSDEMEEIAKFAILAEQDRTQQGLDVQLSQLAPYSREYAQLRDRLGLITSSVNLSFTMSMLNDLAFRVLDVAGDDKEAKIFFDRAENVKKAVYHILGEGDLPERDFHGIDADMEEIILGMIESFIQEKLNAQRAG